MDYNLLIFKTISTFVNELSDIFSSQNHPLKLYQRLINKTTVNHEKTIEKHILAFRKFCINNRDLILSKNISKLSSVESKIEYSDKVFIDFESIFKSADKDTTMVIFDHLLTISALVDPTSKAKEILKNDEKSKEADFLSTMIEKVEENVDINSSNPMEVVNSIMSSGVFNDLLSNMNNSLQDGSLDLGKLVGTVEKLCSNMAPKGVDGVGGGGANNINLMQMLGSLNLGNLNKGGDLGTVTEK
jgi:hypothetical protein